jgi:ADP-ribosyl-[dinitrogen reductase] hydrolase
MPNPNLHDRILGCLLGGAIGDAWGGPYEGALPQAVPVFPASARLSDDTQLTTATCESIIENIGVEPAHIAGRFRAWFEAGRIHGLGASTMKALRDLGAGAHWAIAGAKGERAAGNGAAMRVAPLAFLLDPVIDADHVLIRDVCRITHHHDEAYAGALAVLVAIRLMVFGSWQPGESNLLELVASSLPDSQVRDRLLRYRGFPAHTLPQDVADCWGSSGFVVESVPLALFAAQAIASQPFESVIAQAVAAGGDADTVASIAGQIAGARGGIDALPADLLARIREVDETRRVAEAFAATVERLRAQMKKHGQSKR